MRAEGTSFIQNPITNLRNYPPDQKRVAACPCRNLITSRQHFSAQKAQLAHSTVLVKEAMLHDQEPDHDILKNPQQRFLMPKQPAHGRRKQLNISYKNASLFNYTSKSTNNIFRTGCLNLFPLHFTRNEINSMQLTLMENEGIL